MLIPEISHLNFEWIEQLSLGTSFDIYKVKYARTDSS